MDSQESGEVERLMGHYNAYIEFVKSEATRKASSPNKVLLQYLNLDKFRCQDDYVEKLQKAQAAIFPADIRSRRWHTECLDLAGNPETPDSSLDNPIRMKFLEWKRECESLIDYYRTWRDAEVEFTQAFIDEASRELGTLAEIELDYQAVRTRMIQAVKLERIDLAPVFATAEPLLAKVRRLAKRAQEGLLDDVADDMLLQIGEQWQALESTLAAQACLGSDVRICEQWIALDTAMGVDGLEDSKKDDLRHYHTVRCLYDLACDVHKESEWFEHLRDFPPRQP